MKARTRKVPATTNNITTGIVNFLNSKGHCAFRVNTAGIWDRVAGTYRRMPAASLGCPDVIACMSHSRALVPNGLFVGFEIKNEQTNDRKSEDQKLFHKRIEYAGGTVITVPSLSYFMDWYASSSFK